MELNVRIYIVKLYGVILITELKFDLSAYMFINLVRFPIKHLTINIYHSHRTGVCLIHFLFKRILV